MGFFASLMGLTSTGKYMAAKNALVAKYAFQNLDDSMKKKVDNRIYQMLIEGGFSADSALRKKGNMGELEYFGMAAFALDSFGILPPLKGICFMNHWEIVNNPLTALIDADKEIKTASDEIKKKHDIFIMVSDKLNFYSEQLKVNLELEIKRKEVAEQVARATRERLQQEDAERSKRNSEVLNNLRRSTPRSDNNSKVDFIKCNSCTTIFENKKSCPEISVKCPKCFYLVHVSSNRI